MKTNKTINILLFLLAIVISTTSIFAASPVLQSYTTNPQVVKSGEAFDLEAVISATGPGTTGDLLIILDTQDQFTLLSSNPKWEIKNLQTNEITRLTWKLKSLGGSSGTYTIPLEICTKLEESCQKHRLEIKIQNDPEIRIFTKSQQVGVEKETPITLEVKNVGEGIARNVLIEFGNVNTDSFTVLGSTSFYFEKLDIGELIPIDIRAYVPSQDSKVAKSTINITYETQAGIKEVYSQTLNFYLNVDADIEVVTSQNYLQGGLNEFSIDVVNKGYNKVDFVKIEVDTKKLQEQGIEVFEGKQAYIGNLNSDDFSTIELKMYVNKKAIGKKITIPVLVTYQHLGEKELLNQTLDLRIITNAEKSKLIPDKGSTWIIWVLIIAVIVYYFYRKRKAHQRKHKILENNNQIKI